MTKKYGSLNSLATNPELDDAVKLDTLFGQTIEISAYDVIDVGSNQCALIKSDHGKISSFSKVILDQLKLMSDELAEGTIFKVRAVKEKNYYKFEEVE